MSLYRKVFDTNTTGFLGGNVAQVFDTMLLFSWKSGATFPRIKQTLWATTYEGTYKILGKIVIDV